MNRRQILKGLAALPVIAIAGIAAAKAEGGVPSWEQVKAAKELIDRRKYFYVTSTPERAMAVWNAMGRPENVYCTSIGGMICGRRADMIIMDDVSCEPTLSVTQKARYQEWYDCSLLTRLTPGGQMHEVQWDKRGFDFDNQTGVAASFHKMDWKKGVQLTPDIRNATRIHKRPEEVTARDFMGSQALLLLWYIEQDRRKNSPLAEDLR